MPRGRPPKPAEFERLEGNPGKGRRRSAKDVEDKVEQSSTLGPVGEPFPDMSERAQAKWHELSREWFVILKATDREMLRVICETWEEYVEALEMTREMGTYQGGTKLAPWADRATKARDALRRYLSEVGATPAARQRVEMDTGSAKSKFDGLMGVN